MCNSKTNPGMISVIICTYNRSLLLKEAIDSALSQSYPLMEIIVLDGNSTDNTSDIMKQYESNPSVVYMRDSVDRGPQYYLKYGLRISHGDYVVFMDDDDYYVDKDFFTKAMNIFLNSPAHLSFVSANVKCYDILKEKYLPYHPLNISGYIAGIEYLEKFMVKYSKPTSVFCTIFNKSSLLCADLLDVDWFIDSIIYMRAFLSGDAYIMEDVVGVYRIHDGNLSKRLSPEFIMSGLIEKREVYNIISQKKLFKYVNLWWLSVIKISCGYYVKSTTPRIRDFNRVARWCINTSPEIRLRVLSYICVLKIYLYYRKLLGFVSKVSKYMCVLYKAFDKKS